MVSAAVDGTAGACYNAPASEDGGMTDKVYMVMFPCPETAHGSPELAVSGVFLSQERAQECLRTCLEEYRELVDSGDIDDGTDEPYIHVTRLG